MATMSLQRLAKMLECPVCFGTLNDPRMFTCGHTLCHDCVSRLAVAAKKRRWTAKCPTCRQVTKIDGKVSDLPKPFVVRDVQETLQTLLSDRTDQRLQENASCPVYDPRLRAGAFTPGGAIAAQGGTMQGGSGGLMSVDAALQASEIRRQDAEIMAQRLGVPVFTPGGTTGAPTTPDVAPGGGVGSSTGSVGQNEAQPWEDEYSMQEQIAPSSSQIEDKNALDLREWNYAQLRDFVNTSGNIAFIQLVHNEFQRRIDAHREWKSQPGERGGVNSISTTDGSVTPGSAVHSQSAPHLWSAPDGGDEEEELYACVQRFPKPPVPPKLDKVQRGAYENFESSTKNRKLPELPSNDDEGEEEEEEKPPPLPPRHSPVTPESIYDNAVPDEEGEEEEEEEEDPYTASMPPEEKSTGAPPPLPAPRNSLVEGKPLPGGPGAERTPPPGGPGADTPPVPRPRFSGDPGQQRYFRVPVYKNTEEGRRIRGWWMTHFDGERAARQLQTHIERKPMLGVAGVDDAAMCREPLASTGLMTRVGGEVSDLVFDREWRKSGGEEYLQSVAGRVASPHLRKGVKGTETPGKNAETTRFTK